MSRGDIGPRNAPQPGTGAPHFLWISGEASTAFECGTCPTLGGQRFFSPPALSRENRAVPNRVRRPKMPPRPGHSRSILYAKPRGGDPVDSPPTCVYGAEFGNRRRERLSQTGRRDRRSLRIRSDGGRCCEVYVGAQWAYIRIVSAMLMASLRRILVRGSGVYGPGHRILCGQMLCASNPFLFFTI
jgi:hypothetical protein